METPFLYRQLQDQLSQWVQLGLKAESRDPEDTEFLASLGQQHPDLATTIELADKFLELLRQRQSEAFNEWLMKALGSLLKPFQPLIRGPFDDYATVQASQRL